MKNIHTHHILFYFLSMFFCSNITTWAQKTSTVYTQDSTSIAESEYDRVYRVFLSDKKKIYTLIKFNAVDWGQLKPSIIVEQNMNGNFNIEPKIMLSGFDWSFGDGINYALDFGVDLKFYHNFKRRITNGKKTNGFCGNYVALGGNFTTSDYKKYMETKMIKDNIPFSSNLTREYYQVWSADLKYGIQRRFGSVGYIDVQAGLRYINYVNFGENVLPILRIGIGFGLTKNKALDLIR